MIAPVAPGPEVLVVGAGPAGSVTALLLARKGRRVLLVDRASFPRPKPCGECVNPGAVALLHRLGLLPPVMALTPAELRGWRIASEDGRVATGTFGPDVRKGLGIPRAELDHALVKEARAAGVEFRPGVRVVDAHPHPTRPGVTIMSEDGRRGRLDAGVVVAADGLRSVVARRAGLVEPPEEPRKASATFRVRGTGPPRDRGFLCLGPGFTVGLAPVAARAPLWNLTLVVDPERYGRALSHDPEGLLLRLAARAPLRWHRGPALTGGPWTSGPFHRPSRGAGPPGIVAVGDAAGYFDPLTGQGIYRALRSAEMAGRAVSLALERPERSDRILEKYGHDLERALAPGRRLQKAIEGVVARGPLRRGLLRGLAAAPEAMDLLIGVTGDAASFRSAARPAPWLHALANISA